MPQITLGSVVDDALEEDLDTVDVMGLMMGVELVVWEQHWTSDGPGQWLGVDMPSSATHAEVRMQTPIMPVQVGGLWQH